MADACGESDELAIGEDGRHHDHVVGVWTAAVVRVAGEERIALAHVGRRMELEETLDGRGQTAHVPRMRPARDEPPCSVEQSAAEVMGLAHDGGEARAEDGVLHLSDDAVEASAHHLERDDVESGGRHAGFGSTGRVGTRIIPAQSSHFDRQASRTGAGGRCCGRGWYTEQRSGRDHLLRGAFV